MAKPGPQHEAMKEAFAKRLRQLYPEPPHEYSEGRKVKPVGLKPDVYVRHPDGRQWAFEMVHGNSHASHLLRNHERYAQAGIHDVWILWDDLRPRAGRQASADQGVMLGLLGEERIYPLTKPQRAILEMQTGDVRYLYAFAVDPLSAGRQVAETELMQALAIGVDVYRFVGWDGQERYPATHDYVPMFKLEFAPNGSLVAPDRESEDVVWGSLLSQLGLGMEHGVVPSEWVLQIEQLIASPEGQEALSRHLFESFLKELPPEELEQIVRFFQSAPEIQALPSDSHLPEMDTTQAFQDASVMRELAAEAERIRQHIGMLDWPDPMKKMLLAMINQQQLAHTAEWMAWQDESEALQQTRGEQ